MSFAVNVQYINENGVVKESERHFSMKDHAIEHAETMAGQLAEVHLDQENGDYFDWEKNPDPVTVQCTEIQISGNSYYWIAVTK